METDRTLAMQCIAEMDALRAGVRFHDAAAAALLQPPEKRRPDFDDWLRQREFELRCFLDGVADAPHDLHPFAAQVSWLLTSYHKDANAIRFIIWVMRRVLRVSVPLQPSPQADCESLDAQESGSISWVFLLSAVALWLAMR